MRFPLQLNRRHKAILFLTLLAAGSSLVGEVNLRISFGIVLLGFAFAWALGSNSRPAHYLFILLGVLLAAGPVWNDWSSRRDYELRVQEFEQYIPRLARAYAFDPHGKNLNVISKVELDHLMEHLGYEEEARRNAIKVLHKQWNAGELDDRFTVNLPAKRGGVSDVDAQIILTPKFFEPVPRWYADAVAAGVDMTKVPESEKPGQAPPSRIFDAGSIIFFLGPGVLLIVIGLGLVLAIKR
jgi:hypothetical protein